MNDTSESAENKASNSETTTAIASANVDLPQIRRYTDGMDQFSIEIEDGVVVCTHNGFPREYFKNLLPFLFSTYSPVAIIQTGYCHYAVAIAPDQRIDLELVADALNRIDHGWRVEDGMLLGPDEGSNVYDDVVRRAIRLASTDSQVSAILAEVN